MERNTLIAVISLGFISVTALVLSIIGIASNWHGRWIERWDIMGRVNNTQWQKQIQWQKQWTQWIMNKQYMRLPGSGTIPPEKAIVE